MRKVKMLTSDMLKKIIAEENQKILSEKTKVDVTNDDSVVTHADKPREESWAGGDNLVVTVDHLQHLKKLQEKKLRELKKILELKKRVKALIRKGSK